MGIVPGNPARPNTLQHSVNQYVNGPFLVHAPITDRCHIERWGERISTSDKRQDVIRHRVAELPSFPPCQGGTKGGSATHKNWKRSSLRCPISEPEWSVYGIVVEKTAGLDVAMDRQLRRIR